MNHRHDRKKEKGFTLIEISVVIGMIAILAAVVIMAINPSRQFAQARNSQRVANVTAILNAIGQRIADGQGEFAGAIPGTTQSCPTIASGTTFAIVTGGSTVADALDLSCLVPTYMPSFPSDPAAQGTDTGYSLALDADGRYTVTAPRADLGAIISVTR